MKRRHHPLRPAKQSSPKEPASAGVSTPNVDSLLQEGLAHHRAGRFPEAEALYRQILESAPGHFDALHLLGVMAHQFGKNDTALELIDQAIQIKPNAAEAYNNRGSALHALRQYEAALACFDKAILLNPDYEDAHNNRAITLQAIKQYQEALKSYEAALRSRPDCEDQKEVFESAVKEAARIASIRNKAQRKTELDALPAAIRSHPAISNLRAANFEKNESSGKDLVFCCVVTNETWNPHLARTRGTGGSEEAVIWLSTLLQQRGMERHCLHPLRRGGAGLPRRRLEAVLDVELPRQAGCYGAMALSTARCLSHQLGHGNSGPA